MLDTVKLFVGTSDNDDTLAQKIYLYTLYKNSTAPIDIVFLRPKDFPGWNRTTWGTPFTCYRYAVPHLMGYKGRALYTDVDMLNFRDISALYKTDLEGKAFGMVWDALQDNGKEGTKAGYPRGFWCDSVLLIDCEKAKEFVDPIDTIIKWNKNYSYKWEVMRKLGSPHKEKTMNLVHQLDPRWNIFDGTNPAVIPKGYDVYSKHSPRWEDKENLEIDHIWQLHLTALSYQPWHPKYTPHAKATHPRPDLMREWWRLAKIVNSI